MYVDCYRCLQGVAKKVVLWVVFLFVVVFGGRGEIQLELSLIHI